MRSLLRSPPSLCDLPDELISLILAELPANDRARLAVCSKGLHAAAAAPVVWRRLEFSGPSLTLDVLRSVVARARGGVRKLSLPPFVACSDAELRAFILEEVVPTNARCARAPISEAGAHRPQRVSSRA